ncbi:MULTISPECIES: hypothetical protein [unclassified Nocardia]|uniref:hypothetical protein n=1 Tax=Nocardia sp. NPDC051900 TaxID=3364326 RepID=UPI00379344C1
MVAEKSTAELDEDVVLVAVREAESAAAEGPFPATVTEPPTDRTGPARYLVAACSDVAAIAVGTVGAVCACPRG